MGAPAHDYHPFVKTRCAFNHPIEWAFHWVHVPTRTRIVLGQDEVVTLKLMTKAEKEAWLGAHLEGNRRANSLYPQAGVCLSLARDLDVLKALLAEPEFARKGHGSLRAQLLAMARIAASHRRSAAFLWSVSRSITRAGSRRSRRRPSTRRSTSRAALCGGV